MKIVKPTTAALLYRTLRFGGGDLLSIGILALFRLRAGSNELQGLDRLSSESELWQAATRALGPEALLDAGLPKPRGEFLAYGAAYAPAGAPATLLPATISIGTARKELYVFGDRHFNLLGQISAPEPFERMPLEPARAYGGARFAANPVGRGAEPLADAAGKMRQMLPNVEAPAALIAAPADVRAPAGFWAWPASTPERARLLGPFDERWLAKQWPHLPDGTQTEYFCTAPPDQRIDGFWRGDEPIALRNLHPSAAQLEGALPGLRARCFVHRRVDGALRLEECTARAETVWLFPDLEQGIVLYRAVAAIGDEDADDVLHIIADWERLADVPSPAETYRDRLLEQIAAENAATVESAGVDPTGIDSASVEPTPGGPPQPPEIAPPAKPAQSTPGAVAPPADAGLAEIEKMTAEIETQTQALMKQHGLTERDIAAAMPAKEPEGVPPTLDEINLMSERIERETAALLKQHNLTMQGVKKMTAAMEGESDAPLDPRALGEHLRQMETGTQQILARLGMTREQLAAQVDDPELAAGLRDSSPLDIDALVATLAAQAGPDVEDAARTGTAAASAATSAAMGAARGSAQGAEEGAAATAAPSNDTQATPAPERLTREDVLARVAAGQSLAGLDLSGLDLSNATLAGADFRGALLAEVRFTGSKLGRADLSGCLLRNADLSGADLRGAKLAEVSAGKARFAGAQLDGAILEAGDFAGADFSDASLADAHCARANFEDAAMTGLRAAGCQAEQANFGGCKLGRADFTGAQLRAAIFDRATLEAACFARASCADLRLFATLGAGARFAEADLRGSRAGLTTDLKGADFTHAQLDAAGWLGIDIRGAIFDDCSLERADFSGVQAAGARFARVRAMSIRLAKADLSGADLRHANLFKASLRRARLDGAQMQFSNLYGASCYGSTIGRAQLEGANLDGTLLTIAGRAEAQAR